VSRRQFLQARCLPEVLMMFWLSLVPVVTEWVGRSTTPNNRHRPTVLWPRWPRPWVRHPVRTIIRANARDAAISTTIGSDLKASISIGLYAMGVGLAWLSPGISQGLAMGSTSPWPSPRSSQTGDLQRARDRLLA